MSESDVRDILSDFEPRLRAAVDGAWHDWLKAPDRGQYRFARTRANFVFEHIVRRALIEFDGDAEVHVIAESQTVKFLFRDRVLVRFKKANAAGLGSNIETQTVLAFVDQNQTIPGLLPEVFKVEVCYHLDKLATALDSVAVTARQLDRKLWSYELNGAKPSAEIVPILPALDGDTSPPEVTIRQPASGEAGAKE